VPHGLLRGGAAGERPEFQQGAGRGGAVEVPVGDDGTLAGAPGAAVVGMEVLDQGGSGPAERGRPVPRDAVGVAGVGEDVAERDPGLRHGGQHGGERGDGVVAAGGQGHAAGELGDGRALLAGDHDGGRQVVAEEQLVLIVAQVVLAVSPGGLGAGAVTGPARRGPGEGFQVAPVDGQRAAGVPGFLRDAGFEQPSQAACSAGDGSPSGWSLPSAAFTRLKVYSACR
jgi:hypothetical protein